MLVGQVSKAQFSRLNNWGKSYTTKLGDKDRLVILENGLVDYEASMARLAATADPGRDDVSARHAAARAEHGATHHPEPNNATAPRFEPRAPAPQPQQDAAGSSYQTSRAVKERYLALEAKRAYEMACGDLMRVADVTSVVLDAATTLRTRLEALPDMLSQQLAAPMDEAQRRALIADAVEVVLSGLAAEFQRIAKPDAAP